MATLGDLVVNFTANSRDFDRGTSRVQSGLSSLASFAMKAAAAVGGIFAVKGAIEAAASVETMAVKFKVLTKSEEKAAKVMQQITALAASTPFQKMDIADATQKLLAFGASSETVIADVARLGDIAALTGNPIGELAELYGKARVQGRLFGEDINQLTGRGIPIIQELAKQFGVAESEVKKLVEQGKVGFPEIEKAFIAMTSSGGMFENGMQQLSQTTEGKLSTLKDQLSEIAVQIGQVLLPHVTRWVDILSEGLRPGGTIDHGLKTFISGLETMFSHIESMASKAMAMYEIYKKFKGEDTGPPVQTGPGLGFMESAVGAFNGAQAFGSDVMATPIVGEQIANIARAFGNTIATGSFGEQPEVAKTESTIVSDIGGILGNLFAQLPGAAVDVLGTAGKFLGETVVNEQSGMGASDQLAGALTQGSQEAYSAILSATRGRSVEQAQLQTAQATEQSASLLGEIATGFQSYFANAGVVESFGT